VIEQGPLILRAGHLLTMSTLGDVVNGAVAFDQGSGLILDVGPFPRVQERFPEAEVVGDAHDVVTPGFVNGHDHLSEALISGIGETMSLYEWQERLIRPVGPQLTREMAYVGTLLKGIEMLQSGITCVNDMFVHANPGSSASLGVIDGLDELGMRGVVCFGAHDMPDPLPLDGLMEEHEALAARADESPLVDFAMGIATIHGQSDELFAASVDRARERGWMIHTHLAEVLDELTESRLRFGVNTIGHADATGMLDLDVVFAHCIWVTEPDISLLTHAGSSVVHNPMSNMILGSGLCPVPRLRAAGIPVGLGTDGSASNDSHDMLQVIKSAALLQKMHHLDPSAMTARQGLEMATIEGARALHLEQRVGSIEPGKEADLVRFGGDSTRLAYVHEPYQQVAYCASTEDIRDVWIHGQAVMLDRVPQRVVTAKVVQRARELAAALFEAADLGVLVTDGLSATPDDIALSHSAIN
jgi:cytosine/adenosine deaminase-related metal-dependent hydrolase